ncbi:MAG TPA: MFS transporter [Bacilli bacterium]|nr:MFS transporter [Bacilli bacterium]
MMQHGQLPPSSRWLLVINTLFNGAGALSNTFLNIYLWKFLRSLEQIAIYNLSIFLCIALGYMTAGWVAKRTDRLYTMRAGVAILALFYILILTLGPRVINTYWLLGCLLGFGTGFYWLSYNVLVFEVTEPDTRDQFNGTNGFLFSLATGVAPMIAGKVLSYLPGRGYTVLFLVSFALFIAAVVCTWLLKRRTGPPHYNLFIGYKPPQHGEIWRQTLRVSLLLGFREGTLSFLPFLLVFLVTKNEEMAGRYLLMTAIGSFAAYFFVKKFLTFERRNTFVTVSAFMLALSVLMLLFQVNQVSLFVFGITNALFTPLLIIPYACLTLDVMGRLPEAVHRKVEYLVVRETAVNTGRCLSLLVMIGAQTIWSDALTNRIAFLMVGLSPLLGLFYFRRSSALFLSTFFQVRK